MIDLKKALEKYRRLYEKYTSEENLDQSDIDSFSKTLSKSTDYSSITSSISDEKNQTLVDILSLLKRNESVGYTAQEVADELGISRITARRYLDEMENEGKLELYLEYGKVGRPRNKYRIGRDMEEVDF